jgi:hypothetical protein
MRLPLSPEFKRNVGGDSQRSTNGDSLSAERDDPKCS